MVEPISFDCNLTMMIGARFSVESHGMCNYINYHIFMLCVFGLTALAMLALCGCVFLANRCVVTPGVELLGKVAALCGFMSFGLESWLAFLYLSMLIVFLCVPMSRLVLAAVCIRTRVVAEESVVVVIAVEEEEDDSVVVFVVPDTMCPICLDKEQNSLRRWEQTVCGHRFHTECLRKWKQRTCPMCRTLCLPKS
jgi:hypothetical protein